MPLNLFAALMPKEERFVDLFCEQAKTIVAAAKELRDMVSGENSIEEQFAAIQRLETEADAVAKRIFIAGNRTFNAPIDRENILGLAHDLDDIVDLIEETAKEIRRYEVREFAPEMKEMTEAIIGSAALIQEALPLLDAITREYRKILKLCERIGQIEGSADHCFDQGLTRLRARLRGKEIDTITYIDLKEIFDHLEAVVDKCDDVANAIETITAKHV
jgi:predicted phosphate transport protein (TIGR00153 family)